MSIPDPKLSFDVERVSIAVVGVYNIPIPGIAVSMPEYILPGHRQESLYLSEFS